MRSRRVERRRSRKGEAREYSELRGVEEKQQQEQEEEEEGSDRGSVEGTHHPPTERADT